MSIVSVLRLNKSTTPHINLFNITVHCVFFWLSKASNMPHCEPYIIANKRRS